MALHEQCVGATDEWYTPRHVFQAKGVQFDLDVASPGQAVVPWIPAAHHITRDSLTTPWEGECWMNPPFGARNGLVPWLKKFFEHGCGVAHYLTLRHLPQRRPDSGSTRSSPPSWTHCAARWWRRTPRATPPSSASTCTPSRNVRRRAAVIAR
jgi:hypothetical protein